MPKQVMMWEAKDGDLFDCEEDAVLHDALENLRGMHEYLNDNEIELLDRIIKDNDFREAFVAYTRAKHAADEAEKKRNERPTEIKKVLDAANNRT